jgi:hypothetical protein
LPVVVDCTGVSTACSAASGASNSAVRKKVAVRSMGLSFPPAAARMAARVACTSATAGST